MHHGILSWVLEQEQNIRRKPVKSTRGLDLSGQWRTHAGFPLETVHKNVGYLSGKLVKGNGELAALS